MNKTDLIQLVAESTGLTKKDTEKVLNAAITDITNALIAGEKVSLSGFGSFETKDRAAHIARNPTNGEPMEIGPTRVPTFKPSKALKEMVAKEA